MLTSRRLLAAGFAGTVVSIVVASGIAVADPAYPPVTVDPRVVTTTIPMPPPPPPEPPPDPVDPTVVTTTTQGGSTSRTIPAEVLGEQVSRGANGALPITGGDVAGIAVIGGAALIGGGLLVRASRRRRAAETA